MVTQARTSHPTYLAVGMLCFAVTGQAADGGTNPAPLVCGPSLTMAGECFDGETAAQCSAPNEAGENSTAAVISIDCSEKSARCLRPESLNAWCVADDDAPCAFLTDDGVAQFYCGNGSPGPGLSCDLERGCQTDGPLCDPNDPPKCAGSDLVLSCSVAGQALFLRCPGTCTGDIPGCFDLAEGALCDENQLHCAPDLTCLGDDSGGFGRCVVPAQAGVADAGESSWEPESAGCTCTGTTPPLGAWASLGLLLSSLACLCRRYR